MLQRRALRLAVALCLSTACLPAISAETAAAQKAPPAAPAASPAMPFNFQVPPTRPKEDYEPNTMAETV